MSSPETLKTCIKCQRSLSLIKFSRTRKCRRCYKDEAKERRNANESLRLEYVTNERMRCRKKYARKRERYKAMKRAAIQRQRLLIYEKYGGAFCACCGESDFSVLCLDHINNDGNLERKTLGKNVAKLYAKIKRENYPLRYQVLCCNCNTAKRINGGVIPASRYRHNQEAVFERMCGT